MNIHPTLLKTAALFAIGALAFLAIHRRRKQIGSNVTTLANSNSKTKRDMVDQLVSML